MNRTKYILINIVIIGSIGLMIYNISQLNFTYNPPEGPWTGITSNVAMILAMLINRKALRKKEKERK